MKRKSFVLKFYINSKGTKKSTENDFQTKKIRTSISR